MFEAVEGRLVNVTLARPIRLQLWSESGEPVTNGAVRILALQGTLERASEEVLIVNVDAVAPHEDDYEMPEPGGWSSDYSGAVLIPISNILGAGTVDPENVKELVAYADARKRKLAEERPPRSNSEVRRFVAGRLAREADRMQGEIAELLPKPGVQPIEHAILGLHNGIANLDRRLARVAIAVRCLADDEYDPATDPAKLTWERENAPTIVLEEQR